MKIHEFQAKQLFRNHDIPVPKGKVAHTAAEALAVAEEMGGFPVVLKAQIHAGGRGKGGGVQLAQSREEVQRLADTIIGMTLVTKQTGPEGKLVHKILVEEGLNIEKELYLSILPDRSTAKIVIIASAAGGMDIEEVAEKTPEKISKVQVDPLTGIKDHHCHEVATGLGLDSELTQKFIPILARLYTLFVECDFTLLEINPLVVTREQEIIALDAKVEVDSNALFRQAEIREFRDISEEDELEAQAKEFNLNYINLDGNVGNMVNGAGLAMATMDLIQKSGAAPANFLDVGGGASSEMVENGFKIILGDENVKAILINIFGGILRCDVLAQGVVDAARKCAIQVPVIVRMEGTNVDEGRKILADSGLNLITAVDLKDAAAKVAEVAGGAP